MSAEVNAGLIEQLAIEGRGTAQIVNQSNMEMIRLTSVRPEGKRSEQAEPILITLSEGVVAAAQGKVYVIGGRVRAQAQAAAREVEQLLGSGGCPPEIRWRRSMMIAGRERSYWVAVASTIHPATSTTECPMPSIR